MPIVANQSLFSCNKRSNAHIIIALGFHAFHFIHVIGRFNGNHVMILMGHNGHGVMTFLSTNEMTRLAANDAHFGGDPVGRRKRGQHEQPDARNHKSTSIQCVS